MLSVAEHRERTDRLRPAIEMISGKWRIAVLCQLSEQPLRTSQLQKALREIAPKVLTQTLRGLERDGLVRRKVHAATPPHVEYGLTDPAHLLLSALDELCRWSEIYAGAQADIAREFAKSGNYVIVNTTRKRALPDIIRS